MDCPRCERLKLHGHMRALDARDLADLADHLTPVPEMRSKVERLFLLDVVSFDWNCPQYITPRYTAEEFQGGVAPLKARIADLERQIMTLTAGATP